MDQTTAHRRDSNAPKQAIEDGLTLDELLDLRRLRHDIRLRIHVGTKTARTRFQELEDRWSEIQKTLPALDKLETNLDYTKAILYTIGRRVVLDLADGYRSLREDIAKSPPS